MHMYAHSNLEELGDITKSLEFLYPRKGCKTHVPYVYCQYLPLYYDVTNPFTVTSVYWLLTTRL